MHCLITGATRGLGAELARAFWQAGWSLALVARREDALASLAQALGPREGQTLQRIVADLGESDAPERIVAEVRRQTPRLDALINNAALQGPVGPAWENDWDAWLQALQVDLVAPVALCRGVARWMCEQGQGSIINLSGGGGTSARANFTAYATAKSGLIRFSETLAEELRPHRVRVNCVAPGPMGTDMLRDVLRAGERNAGAREIAVAQRALAEGDATLARATALCLWLASPQAEGISGRLLSAVWDPWETLPEHRRELEGSDIYTLRRIVPKDRGQTWGERP